MNVNSPAAPKVGDEGSPPATTLSSAEKTILGARSSTYRVIDRMLANGELPSLQQVGDHLVENNKIHLPAALIDRIEKLASEIEIAKKRNNELTLKSDSLAVAELTYARKPERTSTDYSDFTQSVFNQGAFTAGIMNTLLESFERIKNTAQGHRELHPELDFMCNQMDNLIPDADIKRVRKFFFGSENFTGSCFESEQMLQEMAGKLIEEWVSQENNIDDLKDITTEPALRPHQMRGSENLHLAIATKAYIEYLLDTPFAHAVICDEVQIVDEKDLESEEAREVMRRLKRERERILLLIKISDQLDM